MTPQNTSPSANRFRFRAWDTEVKKWVTFMPELRDAPQDYAMTPSWHTDEKWQKRMELSPRHGVIVMQSTGLRDKNGKEIWEGDVFSIFGDTQLSVVFWDQNAAYWAVTAQLAGGHAAEDHLLSNLLDTGEVIGNIYENPHLLPKA